jgi:hypothetical protein
MAWRIVCDVCGTGKKHTVFFLGNLKERDHLENIIVDGRIILKCMFKKWGGGVD